MTDRLLQASVLFMAVFVSVYLYVAPDSLLVSLMSTSKSVELLRLPVILGALSMLLTSPPRTPRMRIFLASIACLLAGWVLYSLTLYVFPVLDGLVFSAAAAMFGLAALEITPAKKKVHKPAAA